MRHRTLVPALALSLVAVLPAPADAAYRSHYARACGIVHHGLFGTRVQTCYRLTYRARPGYGIWNTNLRATTDAEGKLGRHGWTRVIVRSATPYYQTTRHALPRGPLVSTGQGHAHQDFRLAQGVSARRERVTVHVHVDLDSEGDYTDRVSFSVRRP